LVPLLVLRLALKKARLGEGVFPLNRLALLLLAVQFLEGRSAAGVLRQVARWHQPALLEEWALARLPLGWEL
jgi:hypothetical protein